MAWLEPLVGECEYLWAEAKWLGRAAASGARGLSKLESARAADAVGRIGLGTAAFQLGGSLVIDTWKAGLPHFGHHNKPATDAGPKTTTRGGTKTTTRRSGMHEIMGGIDYAGMAVPVRGLVTPDTFLGYGPQIRYTNSALVLKNKTRREIQRVLDRVIDSVQHTVNKKRIREWIPDSARDTKRIIDRAREIHDVVRQLPF